jgi:hypothetical protein
MIQLAKSADAVVSTRPLLHRILSSPDCMKMVQKNLHAPRLSVATAHLLSSIALFGMSAARDLYRAFSFTAKSLLPLLQGSTEVRSYTVRCLFGCIRYGDGFVKKDLLEMKPVMNAIFQCIRHDSKEVILILLLSSTIFL